MSYGKKIKLLKRGDSESIRFSSNSSSSNNGSGSSVISIDSILSRRNMEIQKQFGKPRL